jgi:hypothetical protein
VAHPSRILSYVGMPRSSQLCHLNFVIPTASDHREATILSAEGSAVSQGDERVEIELRFAARSARPKDESNS